MSARKEILIVDKKGRPLASQVVGLYNSSSSLVATATTDSYGMATFASIADGLYSVYGTRGSYTTRGNQDILVLNPANYIGSSALITDHGNLTGLSDDDHTQYLKVSSYAPGALSHGSLTNLSNDDHPQYLQVSAFAHGSLSGLSNDDHAQYLKVSAFAHGSLSGLGDDTHTQYALVSGTRTFTNLKSLGTASLGTLNLTNYYSHSLLGSLGIDDHTQYVLTTGARSLDNLKVIGTASIGNARANNFTGAVGSFDNITMTGFGDPQTLNNLIVTTTASIGTGVFNSIRTAGTASIGTAVFGSFQALGANYTNNPSVGGAAMNRLVLADKDGHGDAEPLTAAAWENSTKTGTGTINWNTAFGVPVAAIAVALSCYFVDDAAGQSFSLGAKSTTTNLPWVCMPVVANAGQHYAGVCPIASDGTSYFAFSATFTTVYLRVIGWYI